MLFPFYDTAMYAKNHVSPNEFFTTVIQEKIKICVISHLDDLKAGSSDNICMIILTPMSNKVMVN